jgi:hypothetical protein
MGRVGIHIGSNRDLDGKCSIRSKLNHTFPVVNDISIYNEQLDLPVTAMRSPFPFFDGRYRHFEISALGEGEMRDGLRRLRKAGYATATILTHPGEFFRRVNGCYVSIQKNCRRWRALLEFLSKEPGIVVRCLSQYGPIMHSQKGNQVTDIAAGIDSAGATEDQISPRLRRTDNGGCMSESSIPMFNPLFSLVRIAQQSKHRLWARSVGVRA